MKKKYMFFDIDGTLTNPESRQLVPSAVETLQKLKEKGHFVSIATGRPFAFAKGFANEVGVENYVCSGGNVIVVNQEVVEDRPISKQEVLDIIKVCKENNLPFAITVTSDAQMISEYEEFENIIANAKTMHTIKIVPPMDYESIESFRRVFIACKEGDDIELPLKTLVASSYHKYFLTIEPDDKFLGIERMMEHLHAPIEDVVVFGDGINDVQMFKQAPLAIAMGNAIDEIKQLAHYVTDNSVDDGILNACKYFEWI